MEVLAAAAFLSAPVLLVLVDNSRGLDVSLNLELGIESSSLSVEVLVGKLTLSELKVGTGESLGLPLLEGAVLVVETFRASAGGSGQVLIVLELPVGPSDKVLVSNVTDLVDLLGARTLGQAGSELRDMVGDSESLSISSTGADTLLVPDEALVSEVR